MSLYEFNHRFLIALDFIDRKLKHTASGSNGRHPLLRAVLLRAAKEDIQTGGLASAINKWQHFIATVPGGWSHE